MASYYPPGFGSARDLDYVEGAVKEEELDEPCPKCGHRELFREWWRTGAVTVTCNWSDLTSACDYQRDEGYASSPKDEAVQSG